MKLNATQIAAFDEQGHLFFPGLLDKDEVAIPQQAIPKILNHQGPEAIAEKEDPSVVRLAFGRMCILNHSDVCRCSHAF